MNKQALKDYLCRARLGVLGDDRVLDNLKEKRNRRVGSFLRSLQLTMHYRRGVL